MSFPYVEVFLALLVVYMAYSTWARLDARYPIVAALVLLIVTAIVDASGAGSAANTLAEFVFFLLGAGVVLLLIDHARAARRSTDPTGGLVGTAAGEPAESAQPRQGTTDDPLDRLEQQPVAVVDAPGREHQPDEGDRHEKARWDEDEPADPQRSQPEE